jgi:hypothetical protein
LFDKCAMRDQPLPGNVCPTPGVVDQGHRGLPLLNHANVIVRRIENGAVDQSVAARIYVGVSANCCPASPCAIRLMSFERTMMRKPLVVLFLIGDSPIRRYFVCRPSVSAGRFAAFSQASAFSCAFTTCWLRPDLAAQVSKKDLK